MAKKIQSQKETFNLSAFISLVVGILVSLAVGSGMIRADSQLDAGLWIPGIPDLIVIIAGWIVVVGAIISVIATLFKR